MYPVALNWPGELSDSQEIEVSGFDFPITIDRLAPELGVAPSGTFTIRVQDETGATPANYIEATIASGQKSGTAGTGTVEIAAGGTIYVRIVTANGAEWLLGRFEYVPGLAPSGASNLCSLADLKSWLSITGSGSDARLGFLINGVSRAMERWMDRQVPQHNVSAELHNGDGWSTQLVLRENPIISITEIREDSTALTVTTDYKLVGYILHRIGAVWALGVGNIEADYVAGFATVPESLQLGCVQQCAYEYRQSAPGGNRVGKLTSSLDTAAADSYVVTEWVRGTLTAMRGYQARRF
jgi:hypothetical protein